MNAREGVEKREPSHTAGGKENWRSCCGEQKGGSLRIKTRTTVKVVVTQPCLTLCSPMDYSLPGSSVHGIL